MIDEYTNSDYEYHCFDLWLSIIRLIIAYNLIIPYMDYINSNYGYSLIEIMIFIIRIHDIHKSFYIIAYPLFD